MAPGALSGPEKSAQLPTSFSAMPLSLQEAVRKGITELFLKPSTSSFRVPLPVLRYQYSLRSVRWLFALVSQLLRRARLRALPSAAAGAQVTLDLFSCALEQSFCTRALYGDCVP